MRVTLSLVIIQVTPYTFEKRLFEGLRPMPDPLLCIRWFHYRRFVPELLTQRTNVTGTASQSDQVLVEINNLVTLQEEEGR